jgi:hypothetical protein
MDSRWKEDVDFFVDWMLLGEVARGFSGKRQRQPMKGAWISHGQGKGMRGSDKRLRRFVCIEALTRWGGESIHHAAEIIADRGIPRISADVIRVGYYEVKEQQHTVVRGYGVAEMYFQQYLDWRNWVLYSLTETFQQASVEYRESYGKLRAYRVEALMECIRRQASGPVIKAARMCRRMGPLGLCLLEHDMGSLREHAGELIHSIRDSQARLQPRVDVDAGDLPMETPYTYASPVLKIRVGTPKEQASKDMPK